MTAGQAKTIINAFPLSDDERVSLRQMMINDIPEHKTEPDPLPIVRRWEEAFGGSGWNISSESMPYARTLCYPIKENKGMFSTKEYATSAIAFAQLTHIVADANSRQDRIGESYWHIVPDTYHPGLLIVSRDHKCRTQLPINTREIADAMVNDTDSLLLWNQFYML